MTEAVTGLDLVEQQLRVAAGEPLGFSQADVRLDGYAMELRVVAEDAAGGLPAVDGRRDGVRPPRRRPRRHRRGRGSTVSPFYDSLLAKVIAHGADRVRGRSRPSWTRSTRRGSRAWRRTSTCSPRSSTSPPSAPATCTRGSSTSTGWPRGSATSPTRRSPPPRPRARSARADARPAGADAGDPWPAAVPWRPGRVGEPLRWVARRARADDPDVRGAAGGAATVTIDGSGIAATRTGGDAPVGLEHRDRAGHGARAPGRRRAAGRDR